MGNDDVCQHLDDDLLKSVMAFDKAVEEEFEVLVRQVLDLLASGMDHKVCSLTLLSSAARPRHMTPRSRMIV